MIGLQSFMVLRILASIFIHQNPTRRFRFERSVRRRKVRGVDLEQRDHVLTTIKISSSVYAHLHPHHSRAGG